VRVVCVYVVTAYNGDGCDGVWVGAWWWVDRARRMCAVDLRTPGMLSGDEWQRFALFYIDGVDGETVGKNAVAWEVGREREQDKEEEEESYVRG